MTTAGRNFEKILEDLAHKEMAHFARLQTLSEIGKALRTAQAQEAQRDVSKPFHFCQKGNGWQVKIQGARVRFYAWGKTSKQIKELAQNQGQTPQELFANLFPQVRELKKKLAQNEN